MSKQKSSVKRGDEALTYIISAFYAKIVIILGIALPLTHIITDKKYGGHEGFQIYLYTGSILFLLYMYFVHYKLIKLSESGSVPNCRNSSDSNDIGKSWKKNSYMQYGSFYFRVGVTGFGIGSVIYSALCFGQYWEISTKDECNQLWRAIIPGSRIVFVLLQILFIFSYSNFLDVQKSRIIAKFGLMHMLATNLCECFAILVNETLSDIWFSIRELDPNTQSVWNQTTTESNFLDPKTFNIVKSFFESEQGCAIDNSIMKSIVLKSGQYLTTCTMEYNILCISILIVIWKNNCTQECCAETTKTNAYRKISRSEFSGRSFYSMDCGNSQKGLFGGILALAGTALSLIFFFELVLHEKQKHLALLQVNIWEAALFWTGTGAVILCMIAQRDIDFGQKKSGLELEHLLLLVTQSGAFMYFLFQILGGLLMGTSKGQGGLWTILTPISAIIQSCCQTVLILVAWRRRCSTKEDMQKKPGRQLVTFLLVLNISLWAVNRLKNSRAVSHPNQMNFYGVLAWNIITHATTPLLIIYRFQSTVCFYEIWKQTYKIRPVKEHELMELRRQQ